MIKFSNNDKETEVLLDLWKHFNHEADKTKDRMWTIASWMFTLQAALLAFIAKHLDTSNINKLMFEQSILTAMTAGIGIILSGYTIFMIREYGRHVNHMWLRSNGIREKMPGLEGIWVLKNKEDGKKKKQKDATRKDDEVQGIPPVAWRLIYLCIGFIIIFTALFVIAIL